MENRKNAGKSDSKFGRLDDEHVLELAEEVLGSSDDEIIILDDEADSASDESEDIIDLTDATDIPLDDEEEILDLTDELEDATEEDTDIFELQDIAEQAEDTDDEILELDDTVEEFSDAEADDDIMTLEEEVEVEADADDDIIDLDKAVADDTTGDRAESPETMASKEFSIETDTVELSEADRKALEEEFGFEPESVVEGETPALSETQPPDELPAHETTPRETGLEDTLELADLPETPPESSGADTAELESDPIIELTDEDRTSLEEALSTEMFDDSEASIAEDIAAEGETEEDEMRIESPEADAGAAAPSERLDPLAEATEEEMPPFQESPRLEVDESEAPQAEMQFDVQAPEPTDTDEFGGLSGDWAAEAAADTSAEDHAPDEEELRLDFGEENALIEPEPEAVQLQDELQTEEVPDSNETAEADRQDIEPVFDLDGGLAAASGEETAAAEPADESSPAPAFDADTGTPQPHEDQSLAEDLGLDLDDGQAAETPALEIGDEGADEALVQQTGFDSDTTEADTQAEDDFIESLGMTIETEATPPAAGSAPAETPPAAQDPSLSVDFDQPSSAGAADLHKTADPISIRVQEHAEDNYSHEDQLLSKVFQPESEAPGSGSLEETVERVVNKLFSEKIEAILVNAIERAVTKEIDRLKSTLLGELNRRD